jgi:hypothetical protein
MGTKDTMKADTMAPAKPMKKNKKKKMDAMGTKDSMAPATPSN